MKKVYSAFITLFIMVVCFISAFNVQATVVEYDTIQIDQNMIVGNELNYYTMWWTKDDVEYKEYSIEKVTSSDPDVVSAEAESIYFTIKALKKGKAVLNVEVDTASEERRIFEVPINVYGLDQCRFECDGQDLVLQTGDSKDLGDMKIIYGNCVEVIPAEAIEITSSNEDVAYFVDSYPRENNILYTELPGEVVIEVKVDNFKYDYEKYFDIKGSFKVTVKKNVIKPEKPKVAKQLSLRKDTFGGEVFSNMINVGFDIEGDYMEYEVYCSTAKNKGFKKVGWVKIDGDYVVCSDGSKYDRFFDDIDDVILEIKKYNKKKLKPNKKYFFKVRVRCTDENSINEWSEFSDVREYWTAPAELSRKKFKYNEKTGETRVPKIKYVKAYAYDMSGSETQGYNIFGNPVIYYLDETRVTTKMVFNGKKMRYGLKSNKTPRVYTIAKHNGFYYMDGEYPSKKLKSFTYFDDSLYGSSR